MCPTILNKNLIACDTISYNLNIKKKNNNNYRILFLINYYFY